MKGYEDGEFRPESYMTRAEAAVMFARLMVKKMSVNFEVKGKFSDVQAGNWYSNEIEYLASLGILKGYGDYFAPNAPITRAEFATIASRFDSLSTSNNVSFSDVKSSHWAYDCIISATAKGWIKGYEDGEFRPENCITRAEVVTLVNRVIGRTPKKGEELQKYANLFSDIKLNHWAFADVIESAAEY